MTILVSMADFKKQRLVDAEMWQFDPTTGIVVFIQDSGTTFRAFAPT